MKRSHIFLAVLGVVLLFVGAGAAVYYGVGPAPGGADSGDSITEFPTETAPSGGGGGGGSDDGSGSVGSSTDTPPFTFSIDAIEECGRTCRDVTSTLFNNQNETATGVTVYTRMFAGENNTAEDDLLWEGVEDVGTVEANGSYSTTRRVELSIQEGRQIQRNDGWVTILVTVESDGHVVTFKRSEQVA